MKTKLDDNALTVYTLPTKEDCLGALHNLKNEFSENQYLLDDVPQIEKTIKEVEVGNFKEVLNIKRTTNIKSLYRIIYIFEKDYLHELWSK